VLEENARLKKLLEQAEGRRDQEPTAPKATLPPVSQVGQEEPTQSDVRQDWEDL